VFQASYCSATFISALAALYIIAHILYVAIMFEGYLVSIAQALSRTNLRIRQET
jgi:hypothetical protein